MYLCHVSASTKTLPDSVPEGRLPAEQQRVHPALAARRRPAARGGPGRLRVRGQLRHNDPGAEAPLLAQLAEGHSGADLGGKHDLNYT